jgi:hypothetical protein
MFTARLGRMVWYPLRIVTVPLHVPLQTAPDMIQCAVRVKDWKDGPQDANVDGVDVSVIFVAPRPLTLALRDTGLMTGGAHLKESVALPIPVLAETLIVTWFVDQRAFDDELAANPTAA